MKIKLVLAIITIRLIGISAPPSQATETTIEQMPAKLETQFALSALPPAMRDRATVYLLDPKKGYQLSRQGTSGVTCLVERTVWELADFRNDIYIPLCYILFHVRYRNHLWHNICLCFSVGIFY